MTGGFQVTMSDLSAAARAFRAGAGTFSGVLPGNGPAPADGGSQVVNDAMSAALASVGLLHAQLTAVIEGDAASLDASYAQYQAAETQITHEITAIASPGKAG